MSARRSLVRLGSIVGLALLFPLAQPVALAQGQGGGSGGPPIQPFTTTDSIPPEVHIEPSGGTFVDSLLDVTIYWCDDKELDPDSRKIRHGLTYVTGSFSWQSIGFAEPCNLFGDVYKSEGTIDLSVSGSLTASIEDEFGGHFASDAASYTYSLPQPPTVTLPNHNGDNRDRSLCLTSGAGEAAAYQCGDLLIAHAMPAYATKGRDRSLTLLYNSDQAAPRAVVTAEVSFPAYSPPDTVEATLKVGGANRASALYPGPWGGYTRQISIGFDASNPANWPTGLYEFDLTVRAVYSSTVTDTTITDTLIIVNRSDSEFGQGWSLAGIERLVLDQPGGTGEDILWVGGDGSAKHYRKSGSVWIGAAGAHRDTISLSGSTYTRTLKHGVKVQYWSQGLHIRTINRAQDTTKIKWGGGVIDTIQVPTAGATTRRNYALHYSGSPTKLDSIADPTGRVLAATVNGSGRLTGLTDPDDEGVSFTYETSGKLASRTNRRGVTTEYTYGNDWRLTEVEVPLNVAADSTAITRFTNWDESWLALGLEADPTDRLTSVATRINGPRPSVADSAIFWIDRWGAPTQIRDPFFKNTYITRGGGGNPPALPTRIQYPDGRVVKFEWNNRANLEVQNDSTVGAVTEWTYNFTGVKADSPDSLVAPDDEVTRFTYTTQGLADRVTAPNGHVTDFDYGSGNLKGLVTKVTEESVPALVGASWSDTSEDLETTFTYDNWGNVGTQTTPLGNPITYRRDNWNRVIRVVDAVGDSTGRSYDALNRVTLARVYTSSGTLTTTYDWGIDFLEEVIDPRGVTRAFEHDDAGRLVREIDEQDEADEFGYDEAGNRIWAFTRLLQAQNDSIYFEYDKAGQLTKTKWPNFTNDQVGTEFDYTTPADSIVRTYDEMGRLTSARNFASPDYRIARVYRDDGLILSDVRTNGAGTADHSTNVYEYTAGGKRKKHIVGGSTGGFRNADTIWHHYTDGLLSRTVVHWGYGADTITAVKKDSVQFEWDGLGRRSRLLFAARSGNDAPIDARFSYDGDGRLRRVCTTHNTQSIASDVFTIREVYAYSDDGTLASRERDEDATDGVCDWNAGNFQYSHSYTYDERKQLVSNNGTGGLVDYEFDASGNLTERVQTWITESLHEEYLIPSGSNRISRYFPVYGSDPTKWRDITYHPDGSRKRENPNSSPPLGRRMYNLDGLGRLAGISIFEWSDCLPVYPALGGQWGCTFNQIQPEEPTCSYDPVGRLIDACGGDPVLLSYDGDNVVRTHKDSNEYGWTFVHSPGVDNPIMGHRQLGLGGSQGDHYFLYYITDGNGRQIAVGTADGDDATSVMHSTDSGVVGGNYYYRGGKYAGSVDNSFGFTPNRAPSAELHGLSFFRNRWYDQSTGRWTQEDPIGLAGGVNLYQYVGNNPASYTDPFGLCADEDLTCKAIVRRLREIADRTEADDKDGTVYNEAADRLEAWGGGDDGTGRVILTESSEEPLRHAWYPEVRVYGRAPVGANNTNPNFYFATDQAVGDFVGTLVHEIGHLRFGAGHGPGLRQTCRTAIQQLPSGWRAPDHMRGSRVGC
jgi:RHS repeat-associated protein